MAPRNPEDITQQSLCFSLYSSARVLLYVWRANATELPGWKWQPRDADRFGLDFHLHLSCTFPHRLTMHTGSSATVVKVRPICAAGAPIWLGSQASRYLAVGQESYRHSDTVMLVDSDWNRFMSWDEF